MENKRIFVLPGEIAMSRQPATIATLLGSCVAICLYNAKLQAGGMNHFMLPSGNNMEVKGKYGDYASEKLIEMMLRLDSDIHKLEASLYGGGAVVGHLSSGEGIGLKNIVMAQSVLKRYGIRIKKQEVGGNNGRKIFFDTTSGKVKMLIIEKSELTVRLEAAKKSLVGRKIRVLVVDDSSTIRQVISAALEMDPNIEVVGEAEDAFQAREKILELDPDVITLDIIMPRMDGITFMKKLMLFRPKPIIVVSSIAQKGSRQRARAKDIGAIDVVDKEELKLYQGLETASLILVRKVKAAAITVVSKKKEAEINHI
ncbi:MAG: hypothetical protein IEMM0002_0577 [bacterium]|nr:MAG: hypothetical protein IEMM0002_0577 [bacterium]